MACTESNIPVAELLLEHGASVSLTDIDGETPLFRACLAMCIELVDILLKAGSDPNVFEGFPFQVPDNSDCVTLLNRLIAAGADLQKGSYLSDACMFGHKPLIKVGYLFNNAELQHEVCVWYSSLSFLVFFKN